MPEQVAPPALPLAFVESILNGLQTTGNVPGVAAVLDFNSDVRQNLNGIIDRPTASRFRALVAGVYKMSYNQTSYPETSNRVGLFDIFLNGLTLVSGSQSMSASVADILRANSSNGDIEMQLAANDYFEVRVTPQENVEINVLSYTKARFELVRLV